MTYALQVTTEGDTVKHEVVKMLETLQQGVGGWVEAIELTPNIIMWVNEEGKLLNLKHNRYAQFLFDSMYGEDNDYIVGDVVFTGGTDEEGDTITLSEHSCEELIKVFAVMKETFTILDERDN